jgi:CxxC-x17-CxxC domain-containing protein
MGNFQRGGRGGGDRGGRPSFGGGRGGDRGEITMHKAICDECHKPCEVPFRPSGDKPIYCNDCFGDKRGNEDRGPRRDFGDRGGRRDFGGKPARSFDKPAQRDSDVGNQIKELSQKIDRILAVLEKNTQPKTEVKPVEKKVAPAKAEVKKVTPAKVEDKKKVVKKAVVKKVDTKKKK